MEIHRKLGLLQTAAAMAALLAATSSFAAEKIQITGSTSVQLPKPGEALDESRKSRNFDGPSGRSTYEGSLIHQSPALLPVNPQAEKQFKDALDKKKNWIFVNPYESQYDSKTQEFLQGEKGTALYNHPLMKGDDKGVVQRFLDEKKHDGEPGSNLSDSNNPADRDSESTPGELRGSGGNDLVLGEGKSNPNLNRGLILASPLGQKSLLANERNSFQDRLENNPLRDSIFGSSTKASDRTAFTREERVARDAELGKLYQPRIPGADGLISSRPVVVDPLNSLDVTRQEATPFSGRRTDQLFNVGREQSSIGVGRNSPVFAGPSVSAPGSGLNSRLAERNSFDINARASQSSPFAPSVSSTPASSSASSFKASPFALPLPQRKF